MTEMEAEILQKLAKAVDIDKDTLAGVDENTPLFSAGSEDRLSMGLDSIDMLEVTLMLEKGWGIDVPNEDFERLTSVKAIAEYISEKKAAEPSGGQ